VRVIPLKNAGFHKKNGTIPHFVNTHTSISNHENEAANTDFSDEVDTINEKTESTKFQSNVKN
jgi:hypothetical protein